MAFLASLRSTIAYQTNGSTISTGSIFTTIGNVPTWSNQLTYSTLTGQTISTNSLALASTLTGSSIILSGNVGIGSNAPAYTLDLGSNTIGCGAVNTPSVTTKGTGNLTVGTQSTGLLILNSQGGALALQSAGVTYASVSSGGISSTQTISSSIGAGNNALLANSGGRVAIGSPDNSNAWYLANNSSNQLLLTNSGSGLPVIFDSTGITAGATNSLNLNSGAGTTSVILNATVNGNCIFNVGGVQKGYFDTAGLMVSANNIYTSSTMSLYSGGGGNINLIPSGSSATAFYDAGGTIQIGYINGAGFVLNESKYVAYNNAGNANTWYCFNGGATINAYCLQQGGGNLYELRYLNSTGIFTVPSDRNRKKNIEPIEPVLDRYLQLKPSYFHYKLQEDETIDKSLGLIAQEVEELFNNKNIVSQNEEGIYSLDYGNFTILTIKAVQEQHELVVLQQTEIVDLKAQLALKASESVVVAQQAEIVDLKAQLALKASESVVVAQQTEIVDLKAQLQALKATVDALVASK